MNGTIDVNSEVGQGSTFRFTVLVAPQVVATTEAPALVPAQPSTAPRRRLRILLAEDNLTNQMVATKIIEKIGHDVTVVSNGAQALARVQGGAFDLVLMDVMMPEIDGLTATRTIRKLPSDARNIYIIALTANALRKDDEMCRAAGMNDFVAKPVTRAQLEEALDRYFEHTAATAPAGMATPESATEARLTRTAHDITAFDPAKLDELRHEIGEEGAAEVLGTFFEDTAQRMDVMRAAIRAGDRASLENEAHAMKSSAATFGFMRLSALAKALEAQSKMAMPADAPAQMDQIAAAFADVRGLTLSEQRAA
jgi:CheY-like chemotaxis protein